MCPWEREMTRPGTVSTLVLHEPTERAQDKPPSLLRVSVFPAAEGGPCGDRREKLWHVIASSLPAAGHLREARLENSGLRPLPGLHPIPALDSVSQEGQTTPGTPQPNAGTVRLGPSLEPVLASREQNLTLIRYPHSLPRATMVAFVGKYCMSMFFSLRKPLLGRGDLGT